MILRQFGQLKPTRLHLNPGWSLADLGKASPNLKRELLRKIFFQGDRSGQMAYRPSRKTGVIGRTTKA